MRLFKRERRKKSNSEKRKVIDELKRQEEAQKTQIKGMLSDAQAQTVALNPRIETLRNIARLSAERKHQSR